MIEAVLFDLDGTVANTNDLIYQSFKRMFKEKMNLEVPDEVIYGFFGEPLQYSLSKYADDTKDLMAAFRAFNESNHDQMIKSFDGVKEALEMLKNENIKLGIVTSKREHMAKRSLGVLGLLDYFDVIVTPECTKEHKPNAEPLLKACELLGGINPKNTLMVGDSAFDIMCGNNASATSVAVSYTVIDPLVIKEAEPDYYIDDLRELLELVRTLNEKNNKVV